MSDPQAALNASRVADIPIVTIVRVMNALKAVGYAVVELPQPNGCVEDFATGTTAAWIDLTHGDEEVSAVMGEVSLRASSTYYSPRQSRTLAAALLAAADAAEVTETTPDPHAGQLWANELQSRQRQVPSDREWS